MLFIIPVIDKMGNQQSAPPPPQPQPTPQAPPPPPIPPVCDADCQRQKLLSALKTTLDQKEETQDTDPEGYEQARIAYYTALNGQGWLTDEKNRIASDEIQPVVTNYTNQYNELTNQLKTNQVFSNLASSLEAEQKEDEEDLQFLKKQFSKEKDQVDVLNRLTAIGNPQLIIQVNQPEVVLERNTPLFTASSNIRGVGDADAGRMGDGTITLINNVPLTSVTAGFSSSNGDGSSNVRQTQNQVQLTKQGSFGEYTRNGMINQSMRQSVPTGVGKNEKYRTVAKEGHKMSIGRSY